MKKRFIFIAVSVLLLVCMTVSALAIKTGTFEFDKPLGCQTTKKVVISASNGTVTKTLKNVTARAYFDGTHTLHLSYSQSYSGSYSINAGVDVGIKNVASVKSSFGYSWTSGEVSGYSWDISKGSKVGYYNIQYNKKFNRYPYKFYTRTSTIFSTGNWVLKTSSTILDPGSYSPYFALGYSAN